MINGELPETSVAGGGTRRFVSGAATALYSVITSPMLQRRALLETVERYERPDDSARRILASAVISVGKAIEATATRDRSVGSDPMPTNSPTTQTMLDESKPQRSNLVRAE